MNRIGLLLLLLAGLLATPPFLAAKTAAPPPDSAQELATITSELQENIKDLRRNITSWQQISQDARLPASEKQQWRQKAQAYLQECQAYSDLLARVDPKKLPKTAIADSFLHERQNFLREIQFFAEMLQEP